MKRYKLKNLTVSELLEIASLDQERLPDDSVVSQTGDAQTFINVFRLRPGKTKVPFSFLYRVYRFWSINPQNKSALGRALNSKFRKARGKYETYYLLANPFKSSFVGSSNRGQIKKKKFQPSKA